MKRRLTFAATAQQTLAEAAPALRMQIADTIFDLIEEPEPVGARPYGGIPDAFEIRADAFRLLYTAGPDHVSVWVVEINT